MGKRFRVGFPIASHSLLPASRVMILWAGIFLNEPLAKLPVSFLPNLVLYLLSWVLEVNTSPSALPAARETLNSSSCSERPTLHCEQGEQGGEDVYHCLKGFIRVFEMDGLVSSFYWQLIIIL